MMAKPGTKTVVQFVHLLSPLLGPSLEHDFRISSFSFKLPFTHTPSTTTHHLLNIYRTPQWLSPMCRQTVLSTSTWNLSFSNLPALASCRDLLLRHHQHCYPTTHTCPIQTSRCCCSYRSEVLLVMLDKFMLRLPECRVQTWVACQFLPKVLAPGCQCYITLKLL